MALSRRVLLAAGSAAALARPAILRAQGNASFRIGEINSYSTQPAFAGPYRKGWEMALAHINDLGGLNGRTMEFVSRDDAGLPENAVRLAGELLDQKVDLLAGGFSSEVGLALSDFALQHKKLYVAGAPLASALVWEKGNRYTYRLSPSTFQQAAMLVETVLTMPARTWATVAPDDAYGRSAVKWFRQQLQGRRADVRFVGEQWVVPGQFDARAVVAGLAQPAPDAIFNALFGADLLAFVREGGAQGLFGGRTVASMLTGEPEYLEPLGKLAPAGWIVTGYPWDLSDEPSNKQFVLDYTQRTHEAPRMGSAVGFALVNAIASGILKSGGTDSEAMADGFAEAGFTTPFGINQFRGIDHQSTMGTYVGQLAVQDGKGVMTEWRYVDGATVMPPDDVVRQLRPA